MEKELRIGNFIEYKDFKELDNDNNFDWKVIRVDTDTIAAVQHFNTQFRRILLTEEWLIKLGFRDSKFDTDYRLYPNENIQIIASIVEDKACVMFYTRTIHTDYKPIYIPIHYLHDLQNLYYALTREELKIN